MAKTVDIDSLHVMLGSALAGIGFWFKRDLDARDRKLMATDQTVGKLAESLAHLVERTELVRHQDETRQKFEIVERDIKSLGQQMRDAIQRETTEIRQELHRNNQTVQARLDSNATAINERFDKLITLMTERMSR